MWEEPLSGGDDFTSLDEDNESRAEAIHNSLNAKRMISSALINMPKGVA